MTIDDLAAYLQVSKSSLYKLAQEGKVPGQKVGKHWRFKKDAIDRWLTTTETSAREVTIVPVRGRPKAEKGGGL